jgi:glutamine synthetase
MSKTIRVDYVWLDGYTPIQNMRSKIRILEVDKLPTSAKQLPEWSFDGSSTQQAPGDESDLILKPVKMISSPLQDKDDEWECYIALCEVMLPNGKPHPSNTRNELAKTKKNEFLFSAEQEYVLLDARTVRPLGWPMKEGEIVFPNPQGRYYCGAGDFVKGRNFVEKHTSFSHRAGLHIQGTNAEVMLSQWEYQLGVLPAVDLADEMILSRYLMDRLSEYFNFIITYEPKPIQGDWNGSGCHINFSTKTMREDGYDESYSNSVLEQLEKDHTEHIKVCGPGTERRLTGDHETCHINKFKSGIGDRSASIRIPASAVKDNFYMEDRRPSANCDPYEVLLSLTNSLNTVHKNLNSLKGQEVVVA